MVSMTTKHSRARLAIGTTAGVALTLFAGACTSAGEAPDAARDRGDDDSLTIGISLPSQVQRRWAFDAKYMTEAAEQEGDSTIVQYADYDPSLQNDQVENMLSKGIDVLIIASVDVKAGASIAARAQSQGVPVIAYDLGIADADIDLQVTRDNVAVGQMQAEHALEYAPEGNFAIVRGDQVNTVAQELGEGAAGILDEAAPAVKVVSDKWTPGWDPEIALSDAENVLSRYNDDVQAFVVGADGLASGVIQALRGRNLNGKVFVSGLDAEPATLQLVASGDQTMTAFTDYQQEGEAAIEGARELANGDDITADTTTNNGFKDVPTRQIDTIAVTKDNLCEFITELSSPGWVTVEEVFPDDPDACA